MKKNYYRKHYEGIKLNVAEVVVMLKQPNPGEATKLQAKYRENPLQVIAVLPGDT